MAHNNLRHARSVAASYKGHMRHANSRRLQHTLLCRYPWLSTVGRRMKFHHRAEGKIITIQTLQQQFREKL